MACCIWTKPVFLLKTSQFSTFIRTQVFSDRFAAQSRTVFSLWSFCLPSSMSIGLKHELTFLESFHSEFGIFNPRTCPQKNFQQASSHPYLLWLPVVFSLDSYLPSLPTLLSFCYLYPFSASLSLSPASSALYLWSLFFSCLIFPVPSLFALFPPPPPLLLYPSPSPLFASTDAG